jgi:mono/diheme cytochrome c family protein
MRPAATQFWRKASNVQVSREDPGDIYEKIAAGVQGTGMPAFRHVLSDTEIWQVSLLLKNAGKEIPDPVQNILRGKQ